MRLVERCRTRPIAHVAAEMGISRATASKVECSKKRGTRCGYVYLHTPVDGHTRLAYTESLDDEKGTTAAGFLDRAKTWSAIQNGLSRSKRQRPLPGRIRGL
jgi:hypothetical protein